MEFCTQWSPSYKEHDELIGLAEAERRHQAGETYTVLVPDGASPRVALELTLSVGLVKVFFFDNQSRVVRTMVFSDADSGRLFLQQTRQATFTETDEYGDHPTHVVNTITRPTGLIQLRQGDLKGTMTQADGTMSAQDMDVLWEPLPEWGDWSGYARVDRDKPNPDPGAYRLEA